MFNINIIFLITLIVSFIKNAYLIQTNNDTLIVHIDSGKLRGSLMTSRGGRVFSAFRGIPYAKPPIGPLRFMAPEPAAPWEGILNATKVHNICPQRDIYRRSEIIEGNEDCLYLNVYTPHLPSGNSSNLLPVMVFFHGGGWLCGGGNSQWYGPDLLLNRDIVLVVMNYRLGALGFLSTADETVPGNNGLKDQNLALKWIQNNIAKFGGDPDKVTLFGESAGGASVYYHMLSPMSKGLFKGGISQSGTSLNIWALAPKGENVNNTKILAESFNCPTKCSEEMIQCLQKIDAYEFVKKDKIFMKWDLEPMIPFKPVIEPKHDGAFLSEHPITIIKSGQMAEVPLVVGLNSEDGALRGAATISLPQLVDDLNNDFKNIAPITLMYDKTVPNNISITQRIQEFYFKNGRIDQDNAHEVINMYTDSWFLEGADKTVQLHKTFMSTPVYYYLFAHRGVASFTEIFGGGNKDFGVCHADELQYLFPIGDGLFPDRSPTKDDEKMIDILTTLWANFAKTGNPTPDLCLKSLISEKWQPVSSEAMEYFHIDANSLEMRKGLLMDRAKFWRELNVNPAPDESLDYLKDEL